MNPKLHLPKKNKSFRPELPSSEKREDKGSTENKKRAFLLHWFECSKFKMITGAGSLYIIKQDGTSRNVVIFGLLCIYFLYIQFI